MAVLDQYGQPIVVERKPKSAVEARYDAATVQPNLENYWGATDSLSARLANSPEVRRILRDRARYEADNNCYADGMIGTMCDYVVGTGAQLQVVTEDEEFNELVENLFHEWADVVGFWENVWTMRRSWAVDGEAFGTWTNNPGLANIDDRAWPVTLDFQLVETDQVTDLASDHSFDQIKRDDGIVLDDWGNVIGYRVQTHPGDAFGVDYKYRNEGMVIRANNMAHLFWKKRPLQLRGVPEITPALLLYPYLRRYTLARLQKAETEARTSGVIKSTYPPSDPRAYQPFEAVDLDPNSFLTMPEGWDINQLRTEMSQGELNFKRDVISEIARCLLMPFNVAAANSSDHNFASGKLDHLGFNKRSSITQILIDSKVAKPTFRKWFDEASRIQGHPLFMQPMPPFMFFWPGQEILDPREAGAKATALRNGFETIPQIWAVRGMDYRPKLKAGAKALNMTYDEYVEALRRSIFGEPNEEQQETPEGETEATLT